MKNCNDVVSGLVLLALCSVGAYSVKSLPGPTPPEVVGPALLPSLALIATAGCGIILCIQGLCRAPSEPPWGDGKIIFKVFSYFCLFAAYLASMVSIGEFLTAQKDFPWPHNSGFTVATVLFLLISLRVLGRRRPLELLSVAVLTTAALLLAFGTFFQILLP